MRHRVHFSLVALGIAWLVVFSGCSRGPATDVLRGELRDRLDGHFEDGLFEIRAFHRKGSAPFAGNAAGEERIFVYYDAELAFTRDYSLTGWKGLNLGTLAFVLGATETGIEGFRSKGNAAGDALLVHGRLALRKLEKGAEKAAQETAAEAEGWVPVAASTGPVDAGGSHGQLLRGSGPDALLRDVRDLLSRVPQVERGTPDAVVVSELRRAVSRIDLGVAKFDGALTLGAGESPGTYYAFGRALSEFASRKGLPIYSYASEGSIENSTRVQARSLDLGLVQSDIAEHLFNGWVEEGIFPSRDLRSVASLWPEAVHLVTLESTGITTVGDLKNRRVAIGRRGSGTRFNAVRIGLAAGLAAGEIPEIREIGLADGIAALEAGDVDALFVTEAIPSPGLQAFAVRREDVRFISLDSKVVRELSEAHFAYYPLTVDPRTYPGQIEAFSTLGLACALVTSRHVPDEAVTRVLELLVDGVDELSERHFRAAFVSRETMRLGIAVPLHPAAERFYAARDEVMPGQPQGARSETGSPVP
jgi:TRAP transporter TAXI family solute receptor